MWYLTRLISILFTIKFTTDCVINVWINRTDMAHSFINIINTHILTVYLLDHNAGHIITQPRIRSSKLAPGGSWYLRNQSTEGEKVIRAAIN